MRTNRNRKIILITLVSLVVIASGYVFVRVGPVLFDDLPKVQPDSPVPVASGIRSAMTINSIDYLEPIEVPKPDKTPEPKSKPAPKVAAARDDKQVKSDRHRHDRKHKYDWRRFNKYYRKHIDRWWGALN